MRVTAGLFLRFAALASLLAAPMCDDGEPAAGAGGSGAVGGTGASGEGGEPGSGGSGASSDGGDEPGGAPASGGGSEKGGAGGTGTAGGDGEGGEMATGGTTPNATGGSGGAGASGGSGGNAGSGAGGAGTGGTAGAAGSATCEPRGVDGEPAFWAASGSRIIAVYPDRDFDEIYANLRLSTTGALFRYSPTAMHLAPGRELVTSFNGNWQKGDFEQQSDGSILMVDFGHASGQDYNAVWGTPPVVHAARGDVVETIDFSTNRAVHLNYMSFRPPTDCADVVAVLGFLSASVPGGEDTWTVIVHCGTPAQADYRVFDHLGTLGPPLELDGRHFRYGTRDVMGNPEYWFVSARRTTSAIELWQHGAYVRDLVVCENGRITPYEATSFTPGLP